MRIYHDQWARDQTVIKYRYICNIQNAYNKPKLKQYNDNSNMVKQYVYNV